ncbi:MAG: Trk system potassium transporter TrkA [Bacteroidaceae bacterium]|nr:Trk system potassium transporter TrkA [Bacteroidaceae bacterium]
MKIIIAGAGAVGTHLAKLLSREHHDITLIDETAEKLESIGANFDLMTICASPSSIETLKDADVGSADLFIGVTPDEAHNMTCCMLASKLGARKTVARVDNSEYIQPEHAEFFKTVGIHSLIYPEMLAGQEIMHNIKRSWVRQWWEFHDGALVMLGVKVRETARILDIPLRELCGPESPYHVVAVKRRGDTLIPHGNDHIENGDVVFFMTTPEYVGHIREIAGKEEYPDVKSLYIMGGGHTAVHTVERMPEYMHAKIFEADAKRCERLNEIIDNPHTLVIHGDGRDLDILLEEGIRTAQAFVAATDNSEANILACLAAKRLGVRKTVAMIENLDYVNMAESLDIGSILNKKTLAAGHIYRMMLKADVTTVKSLTVASADVAEFNVPEGSKITRKPIKDLALPETVTLGGLVRDGKGILINGMTQVKAGDTVVAFCLENAIKKIEKYFK